MNNEGKTPLCCAMEQDFNCVSSMTWKLLLEAGADVNVADEEGNTVLMRELSDRGDTNKIEWLIENGSDLNRVSKDGLSVLMMAVIRSSQISNPSLLQLILDHNVDMRTSAITSKDGETPLVKALSLRKEDLASLLFHSGASLNGVSKWMKTEDAIHILDNYEDIKDLCEAIKRKLPVNINLHEMARQAVLASLGHSATVSDKIQKLELPSMVKAHLDINNYRKLHQYEYSCNN